MTEELVKLFYDIEQLGLSDELEDETLATKVLINDVRDGEITVARAFEPLTRSAVRQLLDLGHTSVQVVDIKNDDTVIKAIKKDPAHDEDEAAERHLPPSTPWRSAYGGERAGVAQAVVLRSKEV